MANIERTQIAYDGLLDAVAYLRSAFEYETGPNEDYEFHNIERYAARLYSIIQEQFDLIESYQNDVKEMEETIESMRD